MRKLGVNQLGVLRSMQSRDLKGWYAGCGWLWNTYSGTERICQSLAKRGLVTVSYPHGVEAFYKLTAAGESEVTR